jgi:SAM-dependent methyltransferase
VGRERQQSEAERWDDGCRNDSRRNAFVIPEVARILAVERPSSVLDVGAGTGYVAREVDRRLDIRPEWVLLDINAGRLDLANRLKPRAMAQRTLESDITTFVASEQRFSAALATFTLLEITDVIAFAGSVWQLLVQHGVLIIALPDAWEDVIAESVSRPSSISEYINGRTSLNKVDKFTETPYPFEALRIEALIQCFLELGFHLCEIIRSQLEKTFVLTFRRCAGGGTHV